MINENERREGETIAQHALRILSPIPEEQWIEGLFTDRESRCCVIGHYTRLTSSNPSNYSHENCNDFNFSRIILRETSASFLAEKTNSVLKISIAVVNNNPSEIYPQKTPKARSIQCLKDMVAAGY